MNRHVARLRRRGLRSITYGRAAVAIHRCGFWFVDIPRTSTTSLKSELGTAFGPAFGKIGREVSDVATGQLLPDHLPAVQIRRIVGGQRAWGRLFTFSIVRNPWDRTLSLFRFRQRYDNLPADLTFERYLERLARERGHGLFKHPEHYLSATQMLTDDDGKLLVDYIGRFEHRDEAVATIGERIGLPKLGRHHMNSAGTGEPYMKAYTAWARQLVAEIYSDDVHRFGYRFGGESDE